MENEKGKIGLGTVYSELYNEMRRYRDYELTSSAWYTIYELAILGFITSNNYANISGNIQIVVLKYKIGVIIHILVLIVSTYIFIAACHALWFTKNNYTPMRQFVKDKFDNNKGAIEGDILQELIQVMPNRKIVPLHFLYGVHVLLLFAIYLIIFLRWLTSG